MSRKNIQICESMKVPAGAPLAGTPRAAPPLPGAALVTGATLARPVVGLVGGGALAASTAASLSC